MNWLFQSVPKRYDLSKEMREGATETWLVTRFMDQIKRNDIVFFWMAGPLEIRGLYGWGKIVSESPEYHKSWGYGVDVRYEKKLPNHIPVDAVKALASFENFVLFKTAIGTNFRLSEHQAKDLFDLISARYH